MNQGVGFKSVFSGSDCPHVISKPWQFCFQVNNNDTMGYVTPHWIDDNQVPDVVKKSQGKFQTHIYLPLSPSSQGRINRLISG